MNIRIQSVRHRRHIVSPLQLMLCGETVAVCCENRTEHIDTLLAVRTSQETYHVSATEPNRLTLCGETVAVCCENRTEHTDTVLTSQETHHISATEPNRLMLCGKTVAVCCENRTEHTDTLCGQSVPHRGHTDTLWHCPLARGASDFTPPLLAGLHDVTLEKMIPL
jgi:hypothetical protein